MIWWKVLFQWCSEFSLIFPKTHTERKRKCFFQLRDLVSYWLQINNNIEILTKRIWSFEATTATTMMARLTAAATDWTITTTTSSFTLSSPSTTTKNGCLLNLRTHSHISSHNDGKCVKKLPSRSTVWRCGWWNTSASTPTLCIDKEANMVRLGGDACKSNAKPYSIFSNWIFHLTCWIVCHSGFAICPVCYHTISIWYVLVVGKFTTPYGSDVCGKKGISVRYCYMACLRTA